MEGGREQEAIGAGRFNDEIVPVRIPQRKGDPVLFSEDECPQDTDYDVMSKMKPAFKKDGVGTAGNASTNRATAISARV